jgi:nanoRNase/pAp phosphatase (c-di-AMP/oligoRNAs hydrolase)
MARRSADPQETGLSAPADDQPPSPRSGRFLAGLHGAPRVTFVSHVQPDPDAMGSMWALSHLVETRLGIPTRLTRDGHVSRAENRAMIDVLGVPLVPLDCQTFVPGEKLVMVDSQPGTGRHSLDKKAPIYAVIDHHETPGDLSGVPFTDIRPDSGATCTLVTGYLQEQGIDVPAPIATALTYGIETEITGYPREATPADDDALYFLYPKADKELLAKIRHARLPHSHFECLLSALQSSFIYDRLIISWVNDLPQPEQAAEVVDFMVRFEEVDWAICGGVYRDKMILSLRTSLNGAQAGEVLRAAVGKLGKAGGHDRRAGGCIQLPSVSLSAIEDVQAELRRRLLRVLKIEECRGQRLVPLREMLQNLNA